MNHSMKLISILLICAATSLFSSETWISFKKKTIEKMNKVPGWCSSEKAHLMMDVIKKNKCQNCIEIGVFAGKSLFPIAKALQYNGEGKVFAIDAWDSSEAIKGFIASDPNYMWCSQQNFNFFYKKTLHLINESNLSKFCDIIKRSSQNAAYLFMNETIDFIHLDGNHNEEFVFQDIINYFPKVKDGGFILLNDPNWLSMKSSLVFLLERADIISSFSSSATYFLFRKNNQREQNANALFKN